MEVTGKGLQQPHYSLSPTFTTSSEYGSQKGTWHNVKEEQRGYVLRQTVGSALVREALGNGKVGLSALGIPSEQPSSNKLCLDSSRGVLGARRRHEASVNKCT